MIVVDASGKSGVPESIKNESLNSDGSLWSGRYQKDFIGAGSLGGDAVVASQMSASVTSRQPSTTGTNITGEVTVVGQAIPQEGFTTQGYAIPRQVLVQVNQ